MAMIAVEMKFVSGKIFYTEQEVEIVKVLGSLHSTNHFAFLQNERSEKITYAVKKLSAENLYTSFVSSSEINDVLENKMKQKRFFAVKTVLIVKEAFNLTEMIKKVSVSLDLEIV